MKIDRNDLKEVTNEIGRIILSHELSTNEMVEIFEKVKHAMLDHPLCYRTGASKTSNLNPDDWKTGVVDEGSA